MNATTRFPSILAQIPAARVGEFETWLYTRAGESGAADVLLAHETKTWRFLARHQAPGSTRSGEDWVWCKLSIDQCARVRAKAAELVEKLGGRVVAGGFEWRVGDGRLKASVPTAP